MQIVTRTAAKKHLIQSLKVLATASLILILAIPSSSHLFALSDGQKDIFSSGVNYYDIGDPQGGTCDAADTTLTGSDNQHKIFNYFVSKGYRPEWAAGIIGNMKIESHFDPEDYQGDEKSHALPPGTLGWGLVQWTPPSKILAYATSVHQDPSLLSTQLDFVYKQLEGTAPNDNEKNAGEQLKTTTTAYDAAVSFLQYYERAADHAPDGPNAHARGDYAVSFLAGINGTTGAGDAPVTAPTSACAANVNCTTPGVAVSGLSTVRQNIVCIAQNELATVWTPVPTPPRLQYLKYTQNVYEEWCADFASWVYEQAHYPIQPDPNWRVSLVANIRLAGKAGTNLHYHPVKDPGETTQETTYVPKPGDLAIHYNDSNNIYSHVNIVISTSGTSVTMIGGDQGSGPYGGHDSASITSSYTDAAFTGSATDHIAGYVSPD